MRFAGAFVVGAVLLLTGCAGAPESASTPSVEAESINSGACERFAEATSEMASALSGEDVLTKWEAVRAEMDSAALEADGDVKERLARLVGDWPEATEISVYRDVDGINMMIEDVARACEAEDVSVAVHTFQTD